MSLLKVDELTMRFGGLLAIDAFSMEAQAGQITAIIGPNGAGKTTVFNCLTGFYRPSSGRLLMRAGDREFDLARMKGFRIAQKARVARTFQNIRLFNQMTSLENLLVAQHNKLMRESGYSVYGLLGLPKYRRAHLAAVDMARYWLDQVGLLDVADEQAGNLPYGAQRRLEIARALCIEPLLLCLDEPAAGLNPAESAELRVLLAKIRDEHGIAQLLIEHDMSVVMDVSDHVVVLDYGRCISAGTPQQVAADPAVIRAYLGDDEDAAEIS